MAEMRALALQGRLMLRGLRRKPRAIDSCERVVVFVHGFMAAGPVFDPMREHVERETELPTIDFTYGPHVPFDEIVERFASHVERAAPRNACVSLVGHSLGGIVARWWLQEQGGLARADRVITLATPHAGTETARRWPGSIAAALRPGSPILARLARRRTEVTIPHVAVVAGADRMCSPPESAAKLDGAEVHWLDDLGHNEMLYDPRVLDIVVRALG
jgi:triacylglycerol esterase/lipase EstA (alpha/beta hydrolase family)